MLFSGSLFILLVHLIVTLALDGLDFPIEREALYDSSRAGVSSQCGLNSTQFSRTDGRLNEKEASDYKTLVACLEGNVLAQDYACRYQTHGLSCYCCGALFHYTEHGALCTRFCKIGNVKDYCKPRVIVLPFNWGDMVPDKITLDDRKQPNFFLTPRRPNRPLRQPRQQTEVSVNPFSPTGKCPRNPLTPDPDYGPPPAPSTTTTTTRKPETERPRRSNDRDQGGLKENQVFLKSESSVKKKTPPRKPEKPVWGAVQDEPSVTRQDEPSVTRQDEPSVTRQDEPSVTRQDEPSVTSKPKETIDLLHKPNRPSWVDVQETTTSQSTKVPSHKAAALTVTRPARQRTSRRTTTPRVVFGLGGASVTLQDLGGGHPTVTRTGSTTAPAPAVTKPTVEPGRLWGQRSSDQETEGTDTRENTREAPRRARDQSTPPVWG